MPLFDPRSSRRYDSSERNSCSRVAADLTVMARELLRDPYFPRRAAHELGSRIEAPVQYRRAW